MEYADKMRVRNQLAKKAGSDSAALSAIFVYLTEEQLIWLDEYSQS